MLLRRCVSAGCTAILLVCAAAALYGQGPEPVQTNTDVPWRTSYFPYLSGLSNDGPLISARIRRSQAAPYEERVTAKGYMQLDAGIGFRGTRFIAGQFGAPLLVKNWRFAGFGIASRESRYGFFGIGNETTFDQNNVTDANPFFYRVQRTNYYGSFETSRRMVGPLWFGLQVAGQSVKYVAHDEGTSVFLQTFGTELKETDASVRGALVYDSRDTEYDPHHGFLLEAGYQVAGGGGNYERLYGIARGYLQIRQGTVLAARVIGSQIYGEPTLDALYNIPAWERPVPVLGGQFSFRALETGRLAGKGVLLGNFEVRQNVANIKNVVGIILIGFVDAGRVFEDTKFYLTTSDMKVGGGAGVGLRFLRTTAFTLSVAAGPDKTRLTFGFGWMF